MKIFTETKIVYALEVGMSIKLATGVAVVKCYPV